MTPQVQTSKMVFSLTNEKDFYEFCKTNHHKDMTFSDGEFNYSDGDYYYCNFIYKTGKYLNTTNYKCYFFKKLNFQNEFLLMGSKFVDCDDRPDPETSYITYFEPIHIPDSKIMTILPDLESKILNKINSGQRSERSECSAYYEPDIDDLYEEWLDEL